MAPAGIANGQSEAGIGATADAITTPIMTAEAEAMTPSDVQVMGADERSGSDFMLDVFKSLDFDYVCANPGSSFRGLHESIIGSGNFLIPFAAGAAAELAGSSAVPYLVAGGVIALSLLAQSVLLARSRV